MSMSSPTTQTVGGSLSSSQAQTRPSTASDAYLSSASSLGRLGGHGFKSSMNGGLGLSPITEASSAAHSPVSADYPSTSAATSAAAIPPLSLSRSQQQQSQGYTVGKGGFARPTTAGGTVSIGAGSGQVIPLEDVMRKTVKFIADDNVSKMVNVDGAKDVQEVLLRVLKKFGRIPPNSYPASNPHRGRHENGDLYAEMEGYGVLSSGPDGVGQSKPCPALAEHVNFGIHADEVLSLQRELSQSPTCGIYASLRLDQSEHVALYCASCTSRLLRQTRCACTKLGSCATFSAKICPKRR